MSACMSRAREGQGLFRDGGQGTRYDGVDKLGWLVSLRAPAGAHGAVMARHRTKFLTTALVCFVYLLVHALRKARERPSGP